LPLNTYGSGTSRVTEKTTGSRAATIAVGATKAGVNRDFMDTPTKTFFKVTGEKLIRFHQSNLFY
jgi:hypothetical protein